jgi:hypothetical protein
MGSTEEKKSDLKTKLDNVIKKSDAQKRILKKILTRLNNDSDELEKDVEGNSMNNWQL